MNDLAVFEQQRILSIRDGVAYVDVSTKKYHVYTMIDVADLSLMFDGETKWSAMKIKNKLYVARRIGGRKNPQFQYLHRIILGLTHRTIQVDHRNGHGLDNRRSNLRPSTNQQNSRNGARHRDGSSRFRGVSWDSARGKWTAGIGLDGKRYSLGRFDDEETAARAYDDAAAKHYGEFSRPNFGASE